MWKILFVPIVLAVIILCEGKVVVHVDSRVGNDAVCIVNPSTPCKSLRRALGLIHHDNDTEHIVLLLSNGVHLITEELTIQESTLVSVKIEPVSIHGAVIRCESDGSGISAVGSVNVTIVGIVIENCGPRSAGISLNGSESLFLQDCIFRRNIGVPVLVYNVRNVEITMCQFRDNHNLYPAEITDGTSPFVVTKSGAGLSLFGIATDSEVLVKDCLFQNNTASQNHDDDFSQLLFKPHGRGSAILIRMIGAFDSSIDISKCTFNNNHAEVEGAAIYISLSNDAASNQILIRGNTFTKNTIDLGAGGAIGLNSIQFSFGNRIYIEDSVFTENEADSGGAVSFALYDSNENSVLQPDLLHFHNCSFKENVAVHEGTAVGLFSLVHVDDVGFPVHFTDCSFDNNTSSNRFKESSALVVFRFQVIFTGYNHFHRNIGGGLELISAYVQAFGTIVFEENSAVVGGGITMNDRCLLELSPGVEISFKRNHAQESGGAIYAEFPLIRFSVNILNRLCFIQYNDGTGKDVPAQNWKNVSITFHNNSAGLNGAAIYASTMHQCTWFGGNVTVGNFNSIFNFPEEIADQSPFHFHGNTLSVTSDEVSFLHSLALATAPFYMFTTTDYELVQSGEMLSIDLLASDEVNNSREAVWSLESPDRSTILDAVGTGGSTFHYSVPSFNHHSNESTLDTEFYLGVIPLNTLGGKVSIEFETKGCHPGYVYDKDRGTCLCDTADTNIVRCDNSNRYIYLSEGIWGETRERDGKRVLVTARVLPGYLTCSRDGRLPGCLFQFDDIDNQCSSGRKGLLCGTCKEGYGVSMDLQSCSPTNCAAGLVLFLLLCILVICFSLLVLYFNVSLPNELKGFFFYAQVIAVIYRVYIVTKDTGGTQAPLSVMVNLLGFGLPLPLCLSRSLKAHQVAVLTYISPILVITTVIGYIIAARFIRVLSERSALRGITFLFLIVYKYLADASFIFVSCTWLDPHLVFLYDGSKNCTGWELGILGFISLAVMVFFIVPAPFAVGYICVKYPQKFHQWADVLTRDLKTEQRWWGGWDIGRRLPFVFLGYLLVLSSPSVVLFLMCVTATVILIVHISILPYKRLHTNIIEAVILALLLVINSSFVESSSVAVPEQMLSLLIVLPYLYAIGYIALMIGSSLWMKYVPKGLTNKVKQYYKQKGISSNVGVCASDIQTPEQEMELQGTQNTVTSKVSSEQSTSSTKPSLASSSTQQSSLEPEKGGEVARMVLSDGLTEEDTVYREPLLDM